MAIQQFLAHHTQKVETLETERQLAWWNLATTGDDCYAKKMQEASVALRNLYSSAEEFKYVSSLQNVLAPIEKRQTTLILHQYRENQFPKDMIERMIKLESEVETIYTNFRPIVKGKSLTNNDLKKILAESNNSVEREDAWKASKAIGGQVEGKVRELIGLRNESSIIAGFSDYYSMKLELQEIDQKRLFDLLDELERLTTPIWQRYKGCLDKSLAAKCSIDAHEVMPWHYHDPFFQEAPTEQFSLDPFFEDKDLLSISKKFFNAIGLDVEDILARSDLYEREKKSQHAFCVCIDRKQDVRTLCNLRPNEFWMAILLHELGHAVYDKYIEGSLPYLLRTPAHISTTEAIAMLFGRLTNDGDFLKIYCGLDDLKAKEIDAFTKRQKAADLLVFTRWILVMTHFERAMYQNPERNLNDFWWDCVEKYQGVKRVPGRNAPDWAAKLHLACAPVYYQNYILGEMTASQISHYLHNNLKLSHQEFLSSPKVGKWLKEALFAQGASSNWENTLKIATGEFLNPKYFAEDLNFII